jgi:hypothetical protein
MYEVEFKSVCWIEARNPRNARKIISDALASHKIIAIQPTFKSKKRPTKGEAKR